MEQAQLPLSGRRVCVTGSTQGIGLAIASAFVAAGAATVINDHKGNDGGALSAFAPSKNAYYVPADLSTSTGPGDLIAAASDKLGGIDTLVCNAGGFFDAPFAELTEAQIDRTYSLNVKGALLCAQAFAAQVKPGQDNPSIILTGSTNSRAAETDSVAYDMSKGAVLMLVRSLAVSLAARGIRVNGIGPGLVDTPLTAPALSAQRVRDNAVAQIPLGRIGRPADMSGAAMFLASDGAGYITGQMLYVDGGILSQQMARNVVS